MARSAYIYVYYIVPSTISNQSQIHELSSSRSGNGQSVEEETYVNVQPSVTGESHKQIIRLYRHLHIHIKF